MTFTYVLNVVHEGDAPNLFLSGRTFEGPCVHQSDALAAFLRILANWVEAGEIEPILVAPDMDTTYIAGTDPDPEDADLGVDS